MSQLAGLGERNTCEVVLGVLREMGRVFAAVGWWWCRGRHTQGKLGPLPPTLHPFYSHRQAIMICRLAAMLAETPPCLLCPGTLWCWCARLWEVREGG